MYIQYIQGLFQSSLGTADYALVTSSLHYNDSLVTGVRRESPTVLGPSELTSITGLEATSF
jgi:hypothetical protein